MYAALGAGDVSSMQVMNAAQSLLQNAPHPQLRLASPGVAGRRDRVSVNGVGNLLTHMAGCCKPVPGDLISGFVTKNRGVSVHRLDCVRLLKLQQTAFERVIDVTWGEASSEQYEVDVSIEAYDRQGLLRDITSQFANARLNVLSINTYTNRQSNTATMQLRVEVPDLGSLSKLLERIERLKNVISVHRVSD